MKKNRILTIAAITLVALVLFVAAGCKSSGMAVTKRGQLLKINIAAPNDLPDAGEDNLDITISNRGVNNIKDVLVDVEAPAQLIVLDQTNDRGINVSRDEVSSSYHFTIGNLQPGETSHIRYHVRTQFGTMRETGALKVTAWQRDLPGDKLVETKLIKLRG